MILKHAFLITAHAYFEKHSGRRHTGSPLLLNEDEYDEIIKSGAFFCRKVHPVTSKKLLEMLRENVMR